MPGGARARGLRSAPFPAAAAGTPAAATAAAAPRHPGPLPAGRPARNRSAPRRNRAASPRPDPARHPARTARNGCRRRRQLHRCADGRRRGRAAPARRQRLLIHARGDGRPGCVHHPVRQGAPQLELELHVHVLHHLHGQVVELAFHAVVVGAGSRHELARHVRFGIARMAAVAADDVEVHRERAVQRAAAFAGDGSLVDAEHGLAGAARGHQPVLRHAAQRLLRRHRRLPGQVTRPGRRGRVVLDPDLADIQPQRGQVAIGQRLEHLRLVATTATAASRQEQGGRQPGRQAEAPDQLAHQP